MTKREATSKIAALAVEGIAGLPIPKQIEAWQALAIALPTEAQRIHADRIASDLLMVLNRQMDFLGEFAEELEWPGHQHNGPHPEGTHP